MLRVHPLNGNLCTGTFRCSAICMFLSTCMHVCVQAGVPLDAQITMKGVIRSSLGVCLQSRWSMSILCNNNTCVEEAKMQALVF